MKYFWFILVFIIMTAFSRLAKSDTYYYSNGITVKANNFKEAAKTCFKLLNPVYTNEENGLKAIDVCTNPVMVESK